MDHLVFCPCPEAVKWSFLFSGCAGRLGEGNDVSVRMPGGDVRRVPFGRFLGNMDRAHMALADSIRMLTLQNTLFGRAHPRFREEAKGQSQYASWDSARQKAACEKRIGVIKGCISRLLNYETFLRAFVAFASRNRCLVRSRSPQQPLLFVWSFPFSLNPDACGSVHTSLVTERLSILMCRGILDVLLAVAWQRLAHADAALAPAPAEALAVFVHYRPRIWEQLRAGRKAFEMGAGVLESMQETYPLHGRLRSSRKRGGAACIVPYAEHAQMWGCLLAVCETATSGFLESFFGSINALECEKPWEGEASPHWADAKILRSLHESMHAMYGQLLSLWVIVPRSAAPGYMDALAFAQGFLVDNAVKVLTLSVLGLFVSEPDALCDDDRSAAEASGASRFLSMGESVRGIKFLETLLLLTRILRVVPSLRKDLPDADADDLQTLAEQRGTSHFTKDDSGSMFFLYTNVARQMDLVAKQYSMEPGTFPLKSIGDVPLFLWPPPRSLDEASSSETSSET